MTELPHSATQLRRTLSLPMMILYGVGTTVGASNGALMQIIMSSRVLYGSAQQGQIPPEFAAVNRRTRAPITATAAVAGAVLVFALALPLENLARLTSLVVLVVFALVNVALAVLKTRQPIHTDSITVPIWIPIVGFIVSAIFVLFQTVEFALQLF